MPRSSWLLVLVSGLTIMASCTAVPDLTITPIQPLAKVVTVETARPSATSMPILIPTDTALPSVIPSAVPSVTPTILPSPTTDILTSIAHLFPTSTPTSLPTPPTSIWAGSEIIELVPGTPKPYLTTFQLITYYGHPNSPDLGILGQSSREAMIVQLGSTAAEYQALLPNRVVMPAIHFIATVANPEAGEQGHYNQQTSLGMIIDWITFSQSEGLAFILDIQPGRADIMSEFERVRPFLYLPHVHVALDPEFTMTDSQIPGQDLGSLHAVEINLIQASLNEIALELGLNKVLIIHQFESSMVQEKFLIQDYPFVELVFNADGFGTPQTKIIDLQQYAIEPGWEYGGLKLFFDWDAPLLTPLQVLEIQPQPAIIVYQ